MQIYIYANFSEYLHHHSALSRHPRKPGALTERGREEKWERQKRGKGGGRGGRGEGKARREDSQGFPFPFSLPCSPPSFSSFFSLPFSFLFENWNVNKEIYQMLQNLSASASGPLVIFTKTLFWVYKFHIHLIAITLS